MIDQYLIYRREVFQDRSTPAIETQRRVFEDELADVDAAYENFLASNDIGDFAATKTALAAVYQIDADGEILGREPAEPGRAAAGDAGGAAGSGRRPR